MQTFALTLLLRHDPAAIARYRQEHQRVWPEVLGRIREVGVTEMKIFLRGRRLFMYVEASDDFVPERDFARIADGPTLREWDDAMAELQERAPEAAEGEWWASMEEVFDLNWPQHLPSEERP